MTQERVSTLDATSQAEVVSLKKMKNLVMNK